jgi:hypothetical protein
MAQHTKASPCETDQLPTAFLIKIKSTLENDTMSLLQAAGIVLQSYNSRAFMYKKLYTLNI